MLLDATRQGRAHQATESPPSTRTDSSPVERPPCPSSVGHYDQSATKTLQAGSLAEYFILKPESLIDEFNRRAFCVPALILLIGTGLNEELVFRGVMQSASSEALGKSAILYVAVVFAVLHLGYKSLADVVFVFAVGLVFGWIVAKARSVLGVTLSHGITNIALISWCPSRESPPPLPV